MTTNNKQEKHGVVRLCILGIALLGFIMTYLISIILGRESKKE